MFWYQEIGASHEGQRERGCTTLSPQRKTVDADVQEAAQHQAEREDEDRGQWFDQYDHPESPRMRPRGPETRPDRGS